MAKTQYKCAKCGKTLSADEATLCCGEEMRLDVCTEAPSAEHARPFNEDGPCDDGRSGERI